MARASNPTICNRSLTPYAANLFEYQAANHITTIFAAEGAARPRRRADHPLTVLATIEAAYTLPCDVRASTVARITYIWLP